MTEEEYKAEWLCGNHQTDYNNCRFTDDKLQYAKDWIFKKGIVRKSGNNVIYQNNISEIVCKHKLKIDSNKAYCDLLTKWTDKLAVNDELKKLGMTDIIIPNLYSSSDLLTTATLSKYIANNAAIIKCNHCSGWNIIKSNGATITQNMCDKINEWMTLNYAYICGYEAQYENIEPHYIIQTLLCDKPIDYSFWCINGEIKYISLTKKLGKNLEEYIAFVDTNCKKLNWHIGLKPEMGDLPNKFAINVNNMKQYVEPIAKLFDFVRVDMYCVNNKIYFGETTFTPCGGNIQIG